MSIKKPLCVKKIIKTFLANFYLYSNKMCISFFYRAVAAKDKAMVWGQYICLRIVECRGYCYVMFFCLFLHPM